VGGARLRPAGSRIGQTFLLGALAILAGAHGRPADPGEGVGADGNPEERAKARRRLPA
jgi:hypothetical protein